MAAAGFCMASVGDHVVQEVVNLVMAP